MTAFAITISNAVTPSDTFILSSESVTSSSILPIYGQTSETLSDGSGYYYSFAEPTTNAEIRAQTSFTCGVAAALAWTTYGRNLLTEAQEVITDESGDNFTLEATIWTEV